MEQEITYNYKLILKNLVQYLPAKSIVILNSFFILPILTYFLDVKEVSIYVVALQMLNIFCTCSSDWIAKAVLRYYEKYTNINQKKIFLSTIFWLSLFVYFIVISILFFFRADFTNLFAIDAAVLFLVGLLLIPCALRQNLYQILRIQNNYNLYTISIIMYQLLFIVFCLAIFGLLPNVTGIMISMITAITIIDIYILRTIKFTYKLEFKFNMTILKEILIYALPLIATNILYYFILLGPSLIFQSQGRFIETSIMGLGLAVANNIIEPLAGLFIFVNFPVLVKLFEHNKNVKLYFTNLIQLFFYIIIPIIVCFFLYSKDIIAILLPEIYKPVSTILPFFALKLFLHHILKLINIKYHLKGQTYLETLYCIYIMLFSILVTIYFIHNYSIQVAITIMLVSEILLLLINCSIKLKNLDIVNYAKLLKTTIIILLICFFSYFIFDLFIYVNTTIFILIKIVLYFIVSYLLGYLFRRQILV